jgi:hypothetical protein
MQLRGPLQDMQRVDSKIVQAPAQQLTTVVKVFSTNTIIIIY